MRFLMVALVAIHAAAIGAQTPRGQSAGPAGKIDERVVFDSSYGRSRKIWIYTPPGYEARSTTPYPLVVAFDGDEYRDTMPLPFVLDSLLAAKKAPASPHKPIRLVLDVGELEDHATLGGSGPNFRDATRRFHDALVAKGYDVTYTEVPGGNHAERWWRPRLGVGIALLSAGWDIR